MHDELSRDALSESDAEHPQIAAASGDALTPRAAMHVFLAYVGTIIGVGLCGALVSASALSILGRGDRLTLQAMMEHTVRPAITLVALVVATAVVVRLGRQYAPGPRGRREVGLVACPPAWLAVGAALGVAIAICLGAATVAPQLKLASLVGKAALVAAMVLVAPVVDELLFRGILYAGFLYSFSRLGAALLSTGLFVAAHILDTIGAPLAVIPLGLVGLLAVALRVRSGSLLPAMVLHMAYNATIAVAVLNS